jgi:ABC-type lipoprotein release transport system permease subunit
MNTIIKIAWRNIWRNKLRSSLVIASIVLGIWAGLFIMAMTLGLNEQRMNGAVNSYLSHVQLHHPKFLEDQNLKYFITDENTIIKQIKANSNIKSYAERVISTGMILSSKGSVGVQIIGVNPEQEQNLTTIPSMLKSGTYFSKFRKNPIIIGQGLAEKLKLKIKSKIVLSLQDIDKNIISTSFRVEGIFKTNSSLHDGSSIYVRATDLREITGLTSEIHEIAILCQNINLSDKVVSELKKVSGSNKIESWKKIAPELGYAQEMMSSMIYIFMGIVLLALAFSIINTMLMAVLERKKELGMLMAIGMNKRKLFLMILFETIFIAFIATPIGMLLSILSINYFGDHGIDFASVAKGLESLGVGSKIYTFLPRYLYINITLLTILIAFLSSLFPAKRALKLKPTDVIN